MTVSVDTFDAFTPLSEVGINPKYGYIDNHEFNESGPIPVGHFEEATTAVVRLRRYANNDPDPAYDEALLDYFAEIVLGNHEYVIEMRPEHAIQLGQTLLLAGAAAQRDRLANADFEAVTS